MAPARTPPDIIARLNREIVTLLKARELNEKLAAQGVDVVGSTQEEFAAWMRNEIRKWVKLTSTLKLQTD